jgi:hypothetical protein
VVVVGATVVVVVGAVVVVDDVVAVGAVVVVVVDDVVVVGAAVVVVELVVVAGGGGNTNAGGGVAVTLLVTGGAEVVVAAVAVVVGGGSGAGASRMKNFPLAVPLPDATSSKAWDSATWRLLGDSQRRSLKLPDEQGCDGRVGCFQSSARRWQARALRTLPTTVVHPPLAGSSQGVARADRTAGAAGLPATTT